MNKQSVTPVINRPINAGTPYADYLGFTAERFTGYLWDKGDGAIIISLITTKKNGKGHFSELAQRIESLDKSVVVPTPLGQMRAILQRWQFVPHTELETGAELWTRGGAI